jgi:hypothetical protein
VFAVLIAALTVRFLLEPPAGEVKSQPLSAASSDRYGSVPVSTKTLSMINNPNADPDDMFSNFNDGRSPFGLKANAEIWNGRIAMVSSLYRCVRYPFVTKFGILTVALDSAVVCMGYCSGIRHG